MATIDLDRIVELEGGYVDHPQDPGGETKWGISRRFLERIGEPYENIKAMTPERAKALYYEHFVKPHDLEAFTHDRLANLVFDWLVNGGPAVKSLQRILNVTVDGVVGPDTLDAANALTTAQADAVCQQYLYDRMFYFASLTKHPFIKGWLARLVKLGL